MSIENIFVFSFGHSKECYDFYFTNQNVQSKETFFEDTKAAIRQIILDCVAASSIFYNDFEIVLEAKKILLEKGYLEIEIYSNHIQYSYKSSEDNQDETMHFEISQPDYFKENSIYQVSISSAYYSYLKERFIYKSSSDSDKFNSILKNIISESHSENEESICWLIDAFLIKSGFVPLPFYDLMLPCNSSYVSHIIIYSCGLGDDVRNYFERKELK